MIAPLDLRGRLFAAGWFAMAAAVVAVANPVIDPRAKLTAVQSILKGVVYSTFDLPTLLVLLVLPCVCGAAAGFLFGTAILDPGDDHGARWAAVRGIGVALLAFVAYVPLLTLWIVGHSYGGKVPPLGGAIVTSVNVLIYVVGVGVVFVGWLILLVGAGAGVGLYVLRRWLPAVNAAPDCHRLGP